MAEVNPNVPQAVDPEVTADLTRLLQIRGPLGILNVLDTIVPVVSLGDVVTPSINIRGPTFRSTDIFSAGAFGNPPVNTVLADTGPLPAGIYDVIAFHSIAESANISIRFQHRNSTDTANLMEIDPVDGPDVGTSGFNKLRFAYELAVNERLRYFMPGGSNVGSFYSAVIFARVR